MTSNPKSNVWDVAVVGGGVVGLSTALELQSRGQRVVVLDHGRARGRASFGNAGVINCGSVLTVAGPHIWSKALRYATNRETALRIRYRAFPYFARWLTHLITCCNEGAMRRSARALNTLTSVACEYHVRLAKRIGSDHLIRRNGYLKLFRSGAGFAAAALERQILAEVGVRATLVEGPAIKTMEPALTRAFTHALFFEDSASVGRPGQLVEAYWQAFLGNGGDSCVAEVKAIDCPDGDVELVSQGTRVRASKAVVAAGVGSMPLIAPLGYRVPFAAERGYHAHFAMHAGANLNRPVFDAAGSYVAAPADDTIRLSTGIELARPDDPPDPSQLHAVIAEARDSLSLGAPVPDGEWLGCRPSVADGLPVIGAAPRHPQLMLAFGHGHVGFSTGPLTGRIVADLLTGSTPPVSIEPFSIARFA